MNRTDRLYAIVERLRAKAPVPISAAALAEHFEVSKRTIERDLSALQQTGVPIYADTGRRGGYSIDTKHTLPPLNLTSGEVAAIATALSNDGASPFAASGRSALGKILAVLREVDSEEAKTLADRVFRYDSKRAARRQPPAEVEKAVLDRRLLSLTYTARDGASTRREVEPIAVIGDPPHWYLWGWCRLRQAPRAFRIDRIREAALTTEAVPDRGLDIYTHFPVVKDWSILGQP